MIELNFTGMCKDCKTPDLELDYLEIEHFADADNVLDREYSVTCKHEHACQKWNEVINKNKGGDDI